MQLVLISGLSGSGKSVALHALEDSGYFAVDNLPAILIPALVESQRNNRRSTEKIAISIDARTSHTLDALPRIIEDLREHEIDCRTVFLDANDEALTRRFSESRRPHPMAQRVGAGGGIESCIAEERRILMPVANLAHRIDTSGVSTNTLRTWIKDWLNLDQSRITLAFQSFGFKHNLPIDADLVFDARFLPNPFYDPVLRPLTGKDAAVKEFLEADLNVARLVDDIASFLMRWLPFYMRDNRAALTIAIGCTGGQHRSVYIVEELAQRFGTDQQILIRHRDL